MSSCKTTTTTNTTSASDNDVGSHYCYNSPDVDTFTTQVALASQVFSIAVLVLLGLLGNMLMVYAVLATRRRDTALTASSLLLINLAVADLMVGGLVLPMWIVSTASLSWPLPPSLCTVTAFLTVTLMVCSILSLSAIAVDRYLILAFPLRYPTEVTSTRLVIVFASIWTFCFLVAGLPLCGWGQYRFQPQTVPICNPVWVTQVGFAIFLMVCGLMLPFVAMLFSYVRIVQIAKQHIAKIEATHVCFLDATPAAPALTGSEGAVGTHRGPSDSGDAATGGNNNNNLPHAVDNMAEAADPKNTSARDRSFLRAQGANAENSERMSLALADQKPERGSRGLSAGKPPRLASKKIFSKTVRIANRVFTAVGLFFMCWGPYVILNFWSVNNETIPIPYSADLFTTLLAFANSCVNPVLFVLLNKDFRQRVRMLGRKLMPCVRHRQTRDTVGSGGGGNFNSENGLSVVHSRLEADDVMTRSHEREATLRAAARRNNKLSSVKRVAWQ